MSAPNFNEALRQRESYLEAVVLMQRQLLTTTSYKHGALNHVLEPLAQAAGPLGSTSLRTIMGLMAVCD